MIIYSHNYLFNKYRQMSIINFKVGKMKEYFFNGPIKTANKYL